MARNSTSEAKIKVTTNAQEAKNDIEILNNLLKKLQKTKQLMMKEGLHIGPDGKESAAFKKLNQDIKSTTQALKDNRNAQEKMSATLNDLGNIKLKELKRRYRELSKELGNFSGNEKAQAKQWRDDLEKIKKQIVSIEGQTKTFGSTHSSIWSTAIRNITAYVGVFGMFNAVKSGIQQVIRGGEELSDQMAQVRMVSGLAMEDIEELTRRLAKMDTRTTLQELEQISYAGAKLGFGSQGIEGLEAFTRAANQVNVALREDLGEEALTALSKITENMGLIKKMGVEDAMLATSSAMFKLAATSTAAAGPIVEVTKRLAPVAQMSGFAAHEVLALASASDSLQLMPEVVGTALSKLIMALQNNHNLIEKYLSIPEGTIASMFKAGQSMDALMLVMDKMSGKNVTELDGLWKLLGSDGQRLITVVADMANHTDTLRSHLETSTKAFKEATAVTEEYNIQQETAMAYLLRAENLWRNAFINPDSSLSVKEMTKAWYDFTKSILNSDLAMGSIKVTIDVLLLSIRLLIQLLPMITFGLLAKGAAMLVDKLKLAKIATDGFTLSWKKMDAATKSNWIGLVVGGLVQLVYWTKQWISSTSDAEKEQKKLNQAIESMHEKQDQEIANLTRLKGQLDQTNLSQEERNALLSKVRSDYDIYLNYLGIEKNAVVDLTKHYDALVKVMKQRFAYQEREDYKRDVMGGEDGLRMKRRNAGSDLSKYGKGQGVDVDLDLIQTYAQGGKSAEQIMELMFPDINRSVNATSAAETAARTAAGPGAAVGRRSSGSQQNIDFKNKVQTYVASIMAEINKEAEIDAAFASEIGDFDYDKWLRTQVMGEFKVQPDKEALKAARKAAQEEKEALRKDLKDAKERAEGIIAKIDEWYNLQEAAVKDAEAMGQMNKERADDLVKMMEIYRNQSLMRARKAVGSGDQEAIDEWKDWAENMLPKVLADSSEWSTGLMKEITEVDIKRLHDFLAGLKEQTDDPKLMAMLDASSFFDTMMKKSAENKKKTEVLRAQFREKLDTFVKQNQPILLAQEKLENDLSAMGFITETYEEMAARIAEGRAKEPKNVGMKASQRTEMTGQFRWENAARQQQAQWQGTPALDTDNAAQMQQWLQQFAGGAQWASGIQQLDEWMKEGNAEKYKAEIRRFYDALLQYEQGYADNSKETMEQATAAFNDLLGRRMTDREAYAQAGMKFVGQGTIPYTIDITNQQEALQWLRQFATDGQGELEQWAQAFPMIVDWVERIKEAEKDGTIGEAELASLQDAMPQIEALYLRMISFSDNVGKNIEQQVNAMMPSRSPIGLSEMEAQYQQRRDLTKSKWDEQVNKANAAGGPVVETIDGVGYNASAVDLKRQENQALLELDYQYQEQLWQIRQQMGVTWNEEMEHEIAMYQNMLDKQLISEKQFQQKKKQLQINNGLKNAQYYNGLMKDLVDGLQDYEIQAVENKYDKLIQAAQANGQDTTSLEEQKEAEILEIKKKYAAQELAIKIAEIAINTGVAIMQAYAQLGPIGGTVAAALITALGAVQTAMAIQQYQAVMGSSAGTSSKSGSSGAKTKIVSGMLTYDEGNVQSVAVSRQPQQSYLGTDGHVYRARQATPPEGVSLVTRPIATTVQGQPALVAERGPEIVIGRRTTRAIQMNEPELLTRLAQYDRHHGGPRLRTFDDGNLAAAVPGASPSGESNQQNSEQNERIAAALDQNTQMMAAFVQMMTTIQRQGIPAHINKYGTGGLIDEVKSGLKFDAKYNR